MTHGQRALAAMRGEKVDRIPFEARKDLWYNNNRNQRTLPEKYANASLWDVQRDLGLPLLGFGAWGTLFFRLTPQRVEVKKTSVGNENTVEYVTPYGALRTRHVLADELKAADVTGMQVEHMFKDAGDYDALRFVIEDLKVEDNFEEYGKLVDEIGDDGIVLPWTNYVPMHQLMHAYMGYETFYYELNDRPQQVERVHEALLEQQRQIIALAAKCPADAIEVGGNYDEAMTPPPIFEKYITPFYHEVSALFRQHGKILVVHGDGEMSKLLELLRDARIDVVEAVTPAPMTTIDVRSLRRLWQDKVAFWGGIAGVVMTDTYSDEAFEEYMLDLFEAVSPGDRFILGFGDNVPTDGKFERIVRAVELAEEQGMRNEG